MDTKAYWVNRKEIDKKKWDDLVLKTEGASIYVLSFYLDAVAEDWEAYIAEDFSFAVPVAVVRKGGLKRVYPALFQRYIDVIGDVSKLDLHQFEHEILKRYKKGSLNSKTPLIASLTGDEFIYQAVEKEDFKLKTQAKRMLQRFSKAAYTIREENVNTEELSQFIAKELSKKLPIYATKSVLFLFDLIKKAEENGQLYKIGLFHKEELKGGLIGLKFNNRLLYLKGTSTEESQKEGAMYALMNHFIHHGFAHNCAIDFGGSRVEGIRFFFTRFNGKDQIYYHYAWDNSPWYYKLLFAIRDWIKK